MSWAKQIWFVDFFKIKAHFEGEVISIFISEQGLNNKKSLNQPYIGVTAVFDLYDYLAGCTEGERGYSVEEVNLPGHSSVQLFPLHLVPDRVEDHEEEGGDAGCSPEYRPHTPDAL